MLVIPKCGGQFFRGVSVENNQKILFSKPATSIEQQFEMLKSRGLDIGNSVEYEKFVKEMLLHNNYYRLEGYWFDFYAPESYPDHRFLPDISFQQIWSNYRGDALLRLFTFEIIELIEVSFRSVFAYVLAKNHGPFPYKQDNLNCSIDTYLQALNRMKDDIAHSKDRFIHSFKEKYSNDIPPIWMMVEIMSMGEISRWYGDCIKESDKKEIAGYYGIPARVLESWMRSISMVRNRCAHHNRLYGISISGGFVIPKNLKCEKYRYIFNSKEINGFYNIIVACCYMVEFIGENEKIKQLLNNIIQLVETFGLKEEKMGFPEGKNAVQLFHEICD